MPTGNERSRAEQRQGDVNGRRRRVATCVALTAFVAAALATPEPCSAHEGDSRHPVVIESDLGIDDAVALAIALQNPDLEVVAVVATRGVASAAGSTDELARFLDYFNRPDIRLWAAEAGASDPPPECRGRAAAAIAAALPAPSSRTAHPFAAAAYAIEGRQSTVLALGPLTQLATVLGESPQGAQSIARIIVAGDPERDDSWNLARDPEAVRAVRAAGRPLVFVRPGRRAGKPPAWYVEALTGGQGTSLGEALLDGLLRADNSRAHYIENLPNFHDELAVLYLWRPELFVEVGDGIVEPIDNGQVANAITDALSRGRQRKDRVVFVDGPLPADVLEPDVRARRDLILANNGPDEWFAQLLLNELHEHLGAYSIIGAKMGLRAAELLNAPQHAMTVVSAAPPSQPVSCLNDGLLVSTGSTPGRGLFSHLPGPPGTVEASFSFNGRTVTLRLKEEYRARIRAAIEQLLAHFTLEDDGYWNGVRELGLDIWQDWHRRDLFEPGSARRVPDNHQSGSTR